jgi:hypothetical protein
VNSNLNQLFALLIAFQVKHFLADFPLQREYMLKKVSAGWAFLLPLSLHCGVHSFMTFLILVGFGRLDLWWLALVDFATHFVMDRLKAGPKYLGRFNNPRKTSYWAAFGFDQMVHHLTSLYIIWYIVTH